jgi:hypothetical protein
MPASDYPLHRVRQGKARARPSVPGSLQMVLYPNVGEGKMKTKYTPGPWHVGPWGRIVGNTPPSGYFQAGKPLIATVDGDTPEEDANRRLIAAAPELLEALAALARWADDLESMLPASGIGVDMGGSCRMVRKAVERARAAIAKAEGRE